MIGVIAYAASVMCIYLGYIAPSGLQCALALVGHGAFTWIYIVALATDKEWKWTKSI